MKTQADIFPAHIRNDYSIVHPTYARRDDSEVAFTGCSFVVQDRKSRHWLLIPAHLLACGAALDNHRAWAGEVHIRFKSDHVAITLPLFDSGAPLFIWPSGLVKLADILALPISDAASQLIGPTDFIDMRQRPLQEMKHGQPLIMHGYPACSSMWPSRTAVMKLGSATGRYTLEIHPTNDAEMAGYSGSPVFGLQGDFKGMLISANEQTGVIIPASYIERLLDGELSPEDDLPFDIVENRCVMPVAGLINSSAIIANNVIVTGHLSGNAVTQSNVATGGGAQTLTTSPTWKTLCSLTETFTGGNVQISFTDYCTWSGSAPAVYYRIVRDPGGSAVPCCYVQAGGGSAVPDNINVSGAGLDTGCAAGSHTYALQACSIGGTTTSNQAALTVTELKR